MAYQVLARKYRPQKFSDVVGQEHVTSTLANAVTAGRIAHAILLSGPRGTGKTTIARILAKCVNCEKGPTAEPCNSCNSCKAITAGASPDVFEIDGASNNRVENVRDIRENASYMPSSSPYKIYIIDEVHMLSDAAFNALLKILEEPPGHVLFFFATTEPNKIPITILSRCQRYDFKRVAAEKIAAHMAEICKRENRRLSEYGLSIIAKEADGSVRDALSILEQVFTCAGGLNEVPDQKILEILGVIDHEILLAIFEAMAEKDMDSILSIIDSLYREGKNLVRLHGDIIDMLRNILVMKTSKKHSALSGLASHTLARMEKLAQSFTIPYLHQSLDLLFADEYRIRNSSNPRIALEMTFFKLIALQPAMELEQLMEKVEGLKDTISKQLDRPADSPPKAHRDSGQKKSTSTSLITDESQQPKTVKGTEPNDGEAGSGSPAMPDRDITESPDSAWEKFNQWISGISPVIAAGIRDARCSHLNHEKIIITMPEGGATAFFLSNEKHRTGITAKVREFFNRPLKVDFQVEKKRKDDIKSEKKMKRDLQDRVLRHPAVLAALRQLGGRVVDIRESR